MVFGKGIKKRLKEKLGSIFSWLENTIFNGLWFTINSQKNLNFKKKIIIYEKKTDTNRAHIFF